MAELISIELAKAGDPAFAGEYEIWTRVRTATEGVSPSPPPLPEPPHPPEKVEGDPRGND